MGRFRKSGELGHFLTPTSTCWLQKDFAVSYIESKIALFNCETTKQIQEVVLSKQKCLNPQTSQINKLINAQSLLIAGTEDCLLKFVDLKSNKVVMTVVGHADSVSCLQMVSNNLVVSGGHDGSVRMWDLRNFKLINDQACHRRKYDEGTLCLAYTPGFLASGGADSITKLI